MPGSNLSLHDAQAFSQLFEETHLLIFRFVYGMYGGPREDVEDITAETYARAWKARSKFSGDYDAAVSWLLQIARNLVIDCFRREKVRNVIAMDEMQLQGLLLDDLPTGPENHVEYQQQILTLWIIVRSLPIDQKELIVLRYFLGWQVNRIAAHLGLLENTVSVQIRRIIQKIRNNWPE
jgi:RNA polymerase sigma-70 factor (ECF subfamily)